MQKTRVRIDWEDLNTPERRFKASQIEVDMEAVINSMIFKEIFFNLLETRDYKSAERSQWREATPMEIFVRIRMGAEILNPEVDYKLDIAIDDFFSWNNVIGKTRTTIETIYVNTRYFDNRSKRLGGANLLHEEGHKLGFKHDFYYNPLRKDALSYLLGEAYALAHLKLFRPQYKKVCSRSWKSLWFKKVCKQVEL